MNAVKRTFGFIHSHQLAKKHLVSAYWRFIRWQLKSRLNSKFIKVKFLHQTYFFAKKGLTGITGNIYTGLHEFEEMGFLLHFLRSEDTFFDVGANVGSYTLLASSVCKAKSISFEPVPSTFDILKRNIDLNQISHLVKLENKGVGKEKGVIKFSSGEDTTNHVVTKFEEQDNTIEVQIVALNDYNQFAKPILIKIDVEGFETEVLNGAENILHDPSLKAIIIELNGSGERYGYDEDLIHRKLLSFSFTPFRYFPFTRKIEALEKFGESNTIYLRDMDFIKKRVATANHFKIFNQTI
ncbi:MAG TPA: FkbM family methyltransferase [Pedobacter sp.]|nr:FkbM family methyltransferase [Pedobacter sp.]